MFWAALSAGISLIVVAWPLTGWLAKVVIVAGIFGIIKAYYFLKCQSSEWLIERLTELPDEIYRWFALGYIAIGLLLIFVL